jgi:hypothetical protein
MNANADERFGRAWLTFAVVLACHVADEAAHDFLSVYNPNALAIRARFPFFPIPTFTFREWIIGLSAAVLLLLCLTPLAAQGTRWIRMAAIPLGIIVGVVNATMHVVSSIYMHRLMPGVLSSPVLIAAGVWLVITAKSPE